MQEVLNWKASNDVVSTHNAHASIFFASPHEKHYNRRCTPRHALLAMDQHPPVVQTVANEFYHLVCMRQEIASGGIVNWNPLVPNCTAAAVFKVVGYASCNSLFFGWSNIEDPARPNEICWSEFQSNIIMRKREMGATLAQVATFIYLRTFRRWRVESDFASAFPPRYS